MIALTVAEIGLLAQARDLLQAKYAHATPSTDLWLKKGLDGVTQVLRHTVLDMED